MGQSSSRQRRNHQQSVQNVLPNSPVNEDNTISQSAGPSNIDNPSESTSTNSSLQTPSSRSTPSRRSILSFIKPPSRNRTDADTTSSSRNWRRSRRFSKTPANVEQATATIVPTESIPVASSSTSEVKDTPRGDPEEPNATSDPPPTPSIVLPIDEIQQGTDSQRLVRQSFAPNLEIQDTQSAQQADEMDDIPYLTVPDTSNFSDSGQESTSATQPGTLDEQNRPPTHNVGNQFPPSGTLVVVQGVVHTTDAPRPSHPIQHPEISRPISGSYSPHSNTTNPNENSSRSRLSSLLRPRPGSTTISRPSSLVEPVFPHPSDSLNSIDTVSDPSIGYDQPAHSAPLESAQSGDTPARDQPTNISPSSVEVLGTLLSVAAAATAASLLTGNSEAIFPPQSSPPSYTPAATAASPSLSSSSPIASANQEPWATRPTSPTPNAGLADSTATGRSGRLHQAWGNIRERLGLRPAEEQGPDLNPNSTPPTNPNDPRELVLAQMARAFNLGFGIGNENAAASDTASSPTDDDSQSADLSQLPPEGSFERFLVDLQTDLRVTLTNQEMTSEPVPEHALQDSHEEHVDETSSDFANTIPEYALNTEPSHGTSNLSPSFEPATFPSNSNPPDAIPEVTSHPAHDVPHPDEDSVQSSDPSNPSASSSDSIDAQGRINWWRLYRFPPITAPTRGPGVANMQPSPPSSLSSSTPSPPSEATQPHNAPPEANTQPQSGPEGSTTPRSNVVVPVIVVGLQSVNNTDWAQEQEPEAEPMDAPYDPLETTRPRASSEPTFRDNPNRRSWQSRAADAFRNLRPGRRNRPTTTAPNSGSRTFLIYVIGGYYPPEHSIVTGGSNNLDSFEALLELADLLGQVKPPTVSRDDIENSGLEVIAASQLDDYVTQNKVSSNCVERCLICLDEYIPEEDVRVMTCRHAFHRNCVDKWLETGRNNCPACRSKGVNVA